MPTKRTPRGGPPKGYQHEPIPEVSHDGVLLLMHLLLGEMIVKGPRWHEFDAPPRLNYTGRDALVNLLRAGVILPGAQWQSLVDVNVHLKDMLVKAELM